jgi:SanA protein
LLFLNHFLIKLKNHKKKLISVSILFIVIMVLLLYSNIIVNQNAKFTTFDVNQITPKYAALVLGTTKKLKDGRLNQYYRFRMEAAWELYKNGKCSKIVVSGDNSIADYNEPLEMKNDLIQKGVLENDIICDYAGFRTLDSIIRFKEIFQQNSGIVVSQEFHNARAIYIARAYDIDLIGFNAKNVSTFSGLKTKIREIFSRLLCVIDVNIVNRKPKFLGQIEKI